MEDVELLNRIKELESRIKRIESTIDIKKEDLSEEINKNGYFIECDRWKDIELIASPEELEKGKKEPEFNICGPPEMVKAYSSFWKKS